MARSTMRLEELREKAENAAFYVSISYRVVYVLGEKWQPAFLSFTTTINGE